MKTETIILSVGKCSWGKCHACGWGRLEGKQTEEQAKQQILSKDLKGAEKIKVFASGSLLDPKQFTQEFRQWFAEHAKKQGIKEITIESRPEHVTPETLAPFNGTKLTVAIGLESSNNEILKKYSKGFTAEDYLKAVQILHEHGHKVRAYIMVNIPFGTREDFDSTVEFALENADEIVAINTFPHSKAPLFDSWASGEWKPLDREQFREWVEKWEDNPKIETDFSNYLFVPKFPREKRQEINGATIENLNHPHFNLWQDYFIRFYEPKPKKVLLLLPCSYRKPYTRSQTHEKIYKCMKRAGKPYDIQRLVVSNPGVIPIEFSDYYPFNSYDWPEWDETPEIQEQYTQVTKQRVKKFLEKHSSKYQKIVCYYKPDSQTYSAVQQAGEELGLTIQNMLSEEAWNEVKEKKNPVGQKEALASLTAELQKILE